MKTEYQKCMAGEPLPGVTIGENCVIGAGSVVTRSIPRDCVAVGNPCRVIKQVDNEE